MSTLARTLYKAALRLRRRFGEVIETEGLQPAQGVLSTAELSAAFHADPAIWRAVQGLRKADVQQLGLEYLQRAHVKANILTEGRFIPRLEAAKPLKFRVGDVVWLSRASLQPSRSSSYDIYESTKEPTRRRSGTGKRKGNLADEADDDSVAGVVIGWTPSCLTPEIMESLTGGLMSALIGRRNFVEADPEQPFYYVLSLADHQTAVEGAMTALNAKELYASKPEAELLEKIGCFSPSSTMTSSALAGPEAQDFRSMVKTYAGAAATSSYVPQSALRAVSVDVARPSKPPGMDLFDTKTRLAYFNRLPKKVQALAAAGVWHTKYFSGFDPVECHFLPSPVVEELYPEDNDFAFERAIRQVAALERAKKSRREDAAFLTEKEPEAEADHLPAPLAPTKPRKPRAGAGKGKKKEGETVVGAADVAKTSPPSPASPRKAGV